MAVAKRTVGSKAPTLLTLYAHPSGQCLAAANQKSDLNAFITLLGDESLARAAQLDAGAKETAAAVGAGNSSQQAPSSSNTSGGVCGGGRLKGVPVAVKDNFCVKGASTTCASNMLKGIPCVPLLLHCVEGFVLILFLSCAYNTLRGWGRLPLFSLLFCARATPSSFSMGAWFFPCRSWL